MTQVTLLKVKLHYTPNPNRNPNSKTRVSPALQAKMHVGNAFLPRNEFSPYPVTFCIQDTTESSLSRSGFSYPQLTLLVSVARVSTSFIWIILFPLYLIVCGSFYSFKADDPVAVTATMIISAMAFQNIVQNELPAVPYMTRMDVWILFNLFFLFFVMTCNYLMVMIDDALKPSIGDMVLGLVTRIPPPCII